MSGRSSPRRLRLARQQLDARVAGERFDGSFAGGGNLRYTCATSVPATAPVFVSRNRTRTGSEFLDDCRGDLQIEISVADGPGAEAGREALESRSRGGELLHVFVREAADEGAPRLACQRRFATTSQP
jgi:hypothetical protein